MKLNVFITFVICHLCRVKSIMKMPILYTNGDVTKISCWEKHCFSIFILRIILSLIFCMNFRGDSRAILLLKSCCIVILFTDQGLHFLVSYHHYQKKLTCNEISNQIIYLNYKRITRASPKTYSCI